MTKLTTSNYKKSYLSQIWGEKSSFCFTPKAFINAIRKVDKLVLNSLVSYDQRYKFSYPSQSTIAASVGYSREEVNRSVGRLESFGLISTKYRHRNTSVYFISSLLKMKRVITKIGSLIPACWSYLKRNLTPLKLKLSSKLNLSRKSCTRSNLTYISKRVDDRNGASLSNLTKSSHSRPLPVCPPKKTKRHVRGLYKKKGWPMTKDEVQKIVSVIEDIAKTLDLTRYGKANLSIFPPSALKQAHATLLDSHKKGKKIQDPFSFLWSLAHKATKTKGLDINYSIFDKYNFNKETEEPTTSNQIHQPLERRKMHQSYQPWIKPTEKYDLQHELKGYENAAKPNNFNKAASLFGHEIMANLLKRCKHNVITKAMQSTQQ